LDLGVAKPATVGPRRLVGDDDLVAGLDQPGYSNAAIARAFGQQRSKYRLA
jgi:hypothetical protein